MKIHKDELIAIVFSAYLMVMSINVLSLSTRSSELTFIVEVNIWLSACLLILFSIGLFFMRRLYPDGNTTYRILNGSVMIFALSLILDSQHNVYVTLGVVTVVAFILYFSYDHLIQGNLSFRVTKDHSFFIIVLGFLAMSTLLAFATIYRYKTFSTSTYDFGLFAQMYESMRTTGLPTTTLERNTFLSHFAIHFSPIYYVLLPGYLLFSTPEYLLTMQAFIVCSAIFPIYLLCKHFDLDKLSTVCISLGYLFYPATTTPVFYDFHENKFLTVLLLWMLYFYEKKKYVPMAIALVSVLIVKEDAPLYIIFFGLYVLVTSKHKKLGTLITTGSILYFVLVTNLMSQFGYGIMDYRFQLYHLPGEEGLVVVAKNILLNPMYFVNNLFSTAKFEYLIYLLAPLLCVPLITPKWRSLIFLTPMVVMNLMTDYQYQFNIGYQYAYGVSAILFYLAIINISHFSIKWRRLVSVLILFSAFAFVITSSNDRFTGYFSQYRSFESTYVQTLEALSTIPEDSSVTTETFFAPQLYRLKTLYNFPSDIATEYLILDTRLANENVEIKNELIENEGYQMILTKGMAIIYKKP